MIVLLQFLLRLSFGLALAMATLSPRRVTSGYFRNHAYVLLGLLTLATVSATASSDFPIALIAAAAVASYAAAVAWLYEAARVGRGLLLAVALLAAAGLVPYALTKSTSPPPPSPPTVDLGDASGGNGVAESQRNPDPAVISGWRLGLGLVNLLTSGMLLGFTIAAMLLGHWYLNSPSMELTPLRGLLKVLFAILAMRAIVVATAGGLFLATLGRPDTTILILVTLRWLFGMVGLTVLLWMAVETLNVPNTQSATGILYVAVIAVFAGELASLLLSVQSSLLL